MSETHLEVLNLELIYKSYFLNQSEIPKSNQFLSLESWTNLKVLNLEPI
jgi:hypothetical protein